MSKAPRPEAPTFQEIILRLQRYWADNGCVVMQPYDNEVGAGTFHTATTLRSLGPDAWLNFARYSARTASSTSPSPLMFAIFAMSLL